ncbi:unnamed protein product [Bursaphelenchus xylophilus]|nr:unnamed protein product [Bursaphelenchus xylophilus]CAG9087252.1 unnamed protein product [Bursaphelenchus xylophilus]
MVYNIFDGIFEFDWKNGDCRRIEEVQQSVLNEVAKQVYEEQRTRLQQLARDPVHQAKAVGSQPYAKKMNRQATPPLVLPVKKRRDSVDSGFSECSKPPSPTPILEEALAGWSRPTSSLASWTRQSSPIPLVATRPIPLVQPRNSRKPLEMLSEEERNVREQRLQIKAKTSMCHDFTTKGECKYGSFCRFAHDKEELRPIETHPKYKTKICRNFVNHGHCAYGWKCQFRHDVADTSINSSTSSIPSLI